MFRYIGRCKKKEHWHPMIRADRVFASAMPDEKVYHDRAARCLGCPYPAHGLMCHDNKADGSCLRLDLQQLDAQKFNREASHAK